MLTSFFILFGSWRSHNSLSHIGIMFDRKKENKFWLKNSSGKKILEHILSLDTKSASFNTLLAATLTEDSRGVKTIPIVLNTWPFETPCEHAFDVLKQTDNSVSAVLAGCTKCEELQCDSTVGHGGSPDENGETTLDAMIMDGARHDAACVAGLKRVKTAIQVAHAIMQHTSHTMLVGDAATHFAISMGFKEESLHSPESINKWSEWLKNDCQPNFRINVTPLNNCGPYKPELRQSTRKRFNRNVSTRSHDTIGMIAIDSKGNIAAGTSTNGAQHKIPGRVGDSPIIGAGAYVDNNIGAACSTGDGDTLMKFLPAYQTVESIRSGMTPTEASQESLKRIAEHYPDFKGAILAVDKQGQHGAACHGFPVFHYCYKDSNSNTVKLEKILCTV